MSTGIIKRRGTNLTRLILKMSNRHEYNQKILELLKIYLDKYPDVRFVQALWSLGLVDKKTDKFYEESQITYTNLINKIVK